MAAAFCLLVGATPAVANSDQQVLIDAVYKLMLKVQQLEKEVAELKRGQNADRERLRELQKELETVSGRLEKLGESSAESNLAGKDGLKVVVGTFFQPTHAQLQASRLKNRLPYKIHTKQTFCGSRSCWVNYVVVRPADLVKVRKLIPDAYVVSLKLKTNLKLAEKDAKGSDAKDATEDAKKDAKGTPDANNR